MLSWIRAAITAHRNGRLKKVTYLSSSMVFESTEHWPSKEGDERKVPPPLSSCGFQKLAVEYYARAAWDQYKLPAGLAELIERRGGTHGRRVLGARAAGRSGRHDLSERMEEILSNEVTL